MYNRRSTELISIPATVTGEFYAEIVIQAAIHPLRNKTDEHFVVIDDNARFHRTTTFQFVLQEGKTDQQIMDYVSRTVHYRLHATSCRMLFPCL